jgi:hypothetical protein
MRVVGKYSFNDGERFIEENYPIELQEVYNVIEKSRCYKVQNKTQSREEEVWS